jgi:hypothetical protein
MSGDTDTPPAAALDALRARGAARADPVRLRFLEALARRAAAHDGAARRALDDRLAVLLQAFAQRLGTAGGGAAPDTADRTVPGRAGGPLGELAQRLGGRATPAMHPPAARPAAPLPGAAPEPEALEFFRRTWSRLSAEQRLAQSRRALPDNAGPLNSQHLVHRSLSLMRETAPAYFERFVAHVDALLWLEQADAAGAPDAPAAPRKPARGPAARPDR